MHDDDAGLADRLPLAGVKLCCTSIPPEQRTSIAASAAEMGATSSLDLTSDVTHLIVGRIDTPKYAYVARERPDIRVLLPSFVDRVRERWMSGDSVALRELEQECKLPTFYGLKICQTGFTDLEERQALQELVVKEGAVYCGDLTKEVTHLVAKAPEGKKYEFGMMWRQKVVGIEWVRMSVQRGMALEEALFHPLIPVEDRGVGAVRMVMQEEKVELGKRSRESEKEGQGKRKMRRVATDTLGSRNSEVWADIGGGRSEPAPAAGEMQNEVTTTGVDNTVVEGDQPGPANEAARQLFEVDALKGFSGKFVVYDFDQRKANIMHSFLSSNGATIVEAKDAGEENDEQPIIIIVPHNTKSLRVQQIQLELPFRSVNVVNEWWVEKCLHQKELIDTQTPLSQPIQTHSSSGFGSLTICPTSFSGVDLLHFSKAVKLMGATYDETLRPTTSVLICNEDSSLNREKLQYAIENSIPIVSSQWFYDSLRDGKVLPFAEYCIIGSRGGENTQIRFWHPVHNPRPQREQRKGLVRDTSRKPERAIEPLRKERNMSNEEEKEKAKTPLQELDTNSPKKPTMPQAKVRKHGPFEEEDSEDEPAIQDITQDVEDSILQTFRDDDDELPAITIPTIPLPPPPEKAKDSPAEAETPDALPPPNTQARLHDQLSAFLTSHKQKQQERLLSRAASTTSSAADTPTTDSAPPLDAGHAHQPLRRHRTLGRAPSNSNTMLGSSNAMLSRTTTSASNDSIPNTTAAPPSIARHEPDELDALLAAQRGKLEPVAEMFRPSQALSYEDPEALKVRGELLRSLGMRVDGAGEEEEVGEEGRVRMERMGVVRDKIREGGGEGMGRKTRSRTGRGRG